MLGAVAITSTASKGVLGESAIDYLSSSGAEHVLLDTTISTSSTKVAKSPSPLKLPPGPYLATSSGNAISFSTIYRLYSDDHDNFLYGSYEPNDGTGIYTALDHRFPGSVFATIPVPSRLYSLYDTRPFAGFRVGVKDLFDMKGLKTSGGSLAWQSIVDPANATAPALQQIIELGGVLVGKTKPAQFASAADPWSWEDFHYPFNPRGDGYLSCSASSSGSACAVAAYDWLDYAIGTDTGESMRRPAAVSGIYGQRPSQGIISLENVLPLGFATDTAGVFARDPHSWARFAKHWYAPSLHQSSDITGLSPLSVPDNKHYPKTILYPTDYLPLNNSAAQELLDYFIGNMSSLFGMRVKHFDFTSTVQNSSVSTQAVINLTDLAIHLGTVNTLPAWKVIGSRLVSTWAARYGGRFPPIEAEFRAGWATYDETINTMQAYNASLIAKRDAVDWYEKNLQYSTNESCSESVMIYDIGTGGLPSYREEDLNAGPNATLLAVPSPRAVLPASGICTIFACADFTVPIGQVPYLSQVTFVEEMVPVTVNLVVKRECDFVLYNMIEELADVGVLKAVKTGRTAF
ncbi:amidase family protein [Lindgomyces ingoldianus]|uniref:Amidase family protein n=1 Tax=Lindgomyces ingoldianus TaxID=673940 RepID=A0ACB6Q740_9PLEO|nr:amidase family protein [Lindgomyces ingoldianus]KAF2462703.1 amidase family protein [Lindgomyces ingoldianus]